MSVTEWFLGALVLIGGGACAREPVAPKQAPAPSFISNVAGFELAERDARLKYRGHDYRGAIESFERALAENPGDDQVLYWGARAALASDPAAALRWLGRLADTGSDLVPNRDEFAALVDRPEFRAIEQRMTASAAHHRHAVEAFRLPGPGMLVEGIAYDPVEHAFYTGSGTRRKIVKTIEGHPPEDFIGPRPEIDSIGGVRVDVKRRRLWGVSGTDPRMDGYVASEPERNALIELDLTTHAILGLFSLTEPGLHALNDVEIDDQGRPFFTDTASGQIYTLGNDGHSLVPVFSTPPYYGPIGIAADDTGTKLFIADATGVHRLDVVTRTTRRLAQPRGSALGQLDGMYFVRTASGPRLVGIQGLSYGRVLSAALNPALDAVTHVEILASNHPLFDGPTTGAVVGSWLYFIANSQLWVPREPRETIILKVPLELP